jgi:hypothetical protein
MRVAVAGLALLPLLAVLAGCDRTRLTPEDREAVADCRSESDRIFAARNRYQLSEPDNTGTPYSGSGQVTAPSSGLSDQYEREQLVDRCLARGSAGEKVVPGTAPATH